jgi:hypothetical protein
MPFGVRDKADGAIEQFDNNGEVYKKTKLASSNIYIINTRIGTQA